MVCDVTIKCRQWEMHTAQIMALIMVQRLGSMRTMHEFGTKQIRNPANSVSGEPHMLFAYHNGIEGGGGSTRGITKTLIFPYFDVSNIFHLCQVPCIINFHTRGLDFSTSIFIQALYSQSGKASYRQIA